MIPAVILAGGAGVRIGGNKARMMLAGRPMIDHVRDRLADQAGPVAVNAPGALEDHPEHAGRGPLAGIATAIRWAGRAGAPRVLTVPCDMPFLPHDLVARLSAHEAQVCVACTGGDRIWPCAVWSTALAVAPWPEGGAVHAFVAGLDARFVDFGVTSAHRFLSVDTAHDLERAEHILKP